MHACMQASVSAWQTVGSVTFSLWGQFRLITEMPKSPVTLGIFEEHALYANLYSDLTSHVIAIGSLLTIPRCSLPVHIDADRFLLRLNSPWLSKQHQTAHLTSEYKIIVIWKFITKQNPLMCSEAWQAYYIVDNKNVRALSNMNVIHHQCH